MWKTIMINSYLVNVYWNKGIILDHLGRYEETINYYGNAIRMRPYYIYAYYCKVKDLEKIGSYSDADKYIKISDRIE